MPSNSAPIPDCTNSLIEWRLIILIGLALGIIFALNTPDVEGENVGNWFHARLFLTDGSFINLPKSPLFQIYLTPFTLLPYPLSIAIERGCTVFLCFLPIAGVMEKAFGRFIGITVTVFAAPDVLVTTPDSQVFAIALAFLAILVRMQAKPDHRTQALVHSYALLLMAWGFRSNTMLILVIVCAWDLWRLRFGAEPGLVRPKLRQFWSIAAVAGLLLFTALHQSPHRWNNYQLMEETWVSTHGQLASVISQMVGNHFHARDPNTGGEPFDSYFTHKRFFGAAQTLPEMLITNPQEIAKHMIRNVGPLMVSAVSMTAIGEAVLALTPLRGGTLLDHRVVGIAGSASIFVFIVWMVLGLLREPSLREIGILILGLISVIAVSGLLTNASSARILYPVYPLYMVLAAYTATRLIAFLGKRTPKRCASIAALAVIAMLSQGGWARADVRAGWRGIITAAMTAQENGMVFYGGNKLALYQTIDQSWTVCKGLMTAEMPQFIGAFTKINPSLLYSPFEIPPFGQLTHSDYTGLEHKRINCLYVPYQMVEPGPQSITNIKIRTRDFIAPYSEVLLAEGYRRTDLPTGFLVLPPN